jgi:ABC-type transport system involved in multi-copper enzyme maturation permease subunit
MVLLPLLAAAGLVPAERAEGTFDALAALPISMRKIFAMKTITGVVLSAVPLLTAMAVSLAIAGGREMEAGRMAIIYLLCTLTSLSVFFWIFALTVRLPSEARAAMVGIGILMCWGMVTGWIVEEWRGANYSPPLECVSPFSFVLELNWPVRGAEVCIDCAVGTAIAAALSFGASRAISKETKTVE